MTGADALARPAADAPINARVRASMGAFTDAEARVARALLDDYPRAGLETVARFAARASTSGPTILRFVAKLGYENYAAFQDRLRGEIKQQLETPLSRYPGPGDSDIARVAAALIDNIARAERATAPAELAAIVERLGDPARDVIVLGGRFSWILAAYLHHYLRELRPGVKLIRDQSASWADELIDVGPRTVLVVFDFRRYQRDVIAFARGAAAQGAEIVLVTDVWTSPIAQVATVVVPCPVDIPSAFDSGVAGLAMVEMIVAGVVERERDRAKARMASLEALRKTFNLGT